MADLVGPRDTVARGNTDVSCVDSCELTIESYGSSGSSAKASHAPRGISVVAVAEGANMRAATESTMKNILGDMVESDRETERYSAKCPD